MCEFVSWIEVKREEKTQFCYLTDTEVFSSHGKETLQDSKDNDCLGHGAIRTFYNLKPQEGEEHEKRDFWKAILPKEIEEKLKEFDRYWGRMFSSGVFQNDDLRHIIAHAPKEWKEKASIQLLKQTPTNDDLCYIIEYAPKEWKEKAWTQLLKQTPTNYDLCYIIYYAPEELKEKAWIQLLKQTPTNDDLCCIIEYAPKEWKDKAQTLLNSRK